MQQFTFEFHPNVYTETVRSKTIVAWNYEDAEGQLLKTFPGAVILDVFI